MWRLMDRTTPIATTPTIIANTFKATPRLDITGCISAATCTWRKWIPIHRMIEIAL
jgi:hypothetical protein